MLFDNWDSEIYPNPSLNRNASSSQFTSPIHRNMSFVSTENASEPTTIDSPMFTLEKLQWQSPGSKADDCDIAGVATCNNILHILTTNRIVINWDLSNDTHNNVVLSRRPEVVVQRIWCSPSSPFHILVAAQGGVLLHFNDVMKKPMPIRTGNVNVECVCWPPYHNKESEYVILGCDSGAIYMLNLISKEKSLRKVHQLPESNPIYGIEMEMFMDSFLSDRYLIMCATKTRLYEYTGKHFDALFTCDTAPFIELFGNVNAQPSLQFYREDGRAKTVAWLTGCGLYHGKLQFDGRHESSTTVIADYHLLPYPADLNTDVEGPLGLLITRFHFILLFPYRLVCYNQLNSTIVYSMKFPENCGAMVNIVRDPVLGSIFIHSPLQLHEFVIDREDRDIWLHYLNKKDFGSALEFCSTPAQRDQVLCAHGDYLFARGEYKPAAAIYSQSQRPFETVALMFLKQEQSRDALKDFLRRRLDSVPTTFLTQRTMICTWLTEIYLDKLNMLRDAFNDDVYEDLITEFIDFLSVYRDSLDRNTTFDLISSHGRTEELIQYAEIIGAYDWVIRYSIEQQRYSTALELIVSHCENNASIMQMLYRVAPQLIQHEPELTIDAFIKLSDILDGVRLLPALHRCETPLEGQEISPALRYLRHVIQNGSQNPILHNYLVALMVKLPGEEMLLDYLQDQEADTEFDMKFALRLCHQEGKYRCCVRLYEMMSLFPEAARLALNIDPQLAKQVALALDTNSIVSASDRKAIWLSIGRHLLNEQINNGKSLSDAIDLIKQCSPHIQIEDMLPYFPDDLKIGEFRSEIVSCLRQYNERLKMLHDDQETLSSTASALKKDIQSLRNRTVHVKHNQTCDFCHRSLFSSRFYVFPCNHTFHASCSKEELNQIREIIGDRSRKIFESDSEGEEETGSKVSPPNSENAALSCVLCGTDMILTVDAPLLIDELNSLRI